MANKFYATSFALTKLKHAITTTKAGTRCLLIPIDDNHLTEKEGAVYMQTDICVKDEKDNNDNYGFVKQKLPSDKWKVLGNDAKTVGDALPFLANLKIFERSNNDTSGALVNQAEVDIEDESDLPF